MRRKATVVALIAVVAVSLILVWLLRPEKMSAGELRGHLHSLTQDEHTDDLSFIQEQAGELARQLSLRTEKQEEFAEELTDWYVVSRDVDVLLVYNTGGFGGSAMSIDPEWPSILQGIQEYLSENCGDSSTIVEHRRAEYTAIGFIKSVNDIRTEYSSEAPLLAAKLSFINKYNPEVKIIVTGRSFGAVFANEVMRLLPQNDTFYSIQAGRYPRYNPSFNSDDRTLLIEDNGEQPDSWSQGNLWAIMQANLAHPPSSSPSEEGSLQILSWYLIVPGHVYTWELPGLRTDICVFLDTAFAGRQE